jgi:hypothetical protein
MKPRGAWDCPRGLEALVWTDNRLDVERLDVDSDLV